MPSIKPRSCRCRIGLAAIIAFAVVSESLGQQGGGSSPSLPRHAAFALHPNESSVELSLFTGGTRSKLGGSIRLYLGDPSVAVPAILGLVGLSVDGAELVAPDLEPDLPGLTEPLYMIQNPAVRSIGSWNTLTGAISFDLHLKATNGNLPVPQPVHLAGTLIGGILRVQGNNGNVADALMVLKIKAFEVNLPPSALDIWFSTISGFSARTISPDNGGAIVHISDGDLLSRRGHIVRTNHELTARLGIMPIVPDLGLDAAVLGSRGEIWFSFDQETGPMWSETLATWLKPGDLLSDRGYIVQTNEQLLAKFVRMPPVSDVGLDAVERAPNGAILFSTDQSFFCQSMNRTVGHGDLLSNRGFVVRTNAQLLANFHPIDLTMRPIPADYGLDAVVLRPLGEIWFSTKLSFQDANLGLIADGDLLSTLGYIVARNRDLVAAFNPAENLTNFGLDAVAVVVACQLGDFDYNGSVGSNDTGALQSTVTGPAVPSNDPFAADLDGDGDVDQTDFGIFQRCLSGDQPADPACAE